VTEQVWTADRAAACVAGALSPYTSRVQVEVDRAIAAAAAHTNGASERQVPRYEEHKYEDHPEAAHDPCDPKVTGPEVWQTSNTASEILTHAAHIVSGDRAAQHGPKERNHQNIADHWNAYLTGRLDQPLTALDVALMMAELKIARTKAGAGRTNRDNYVDGGGYFGVAGEIALCGKERP
jgi:hypothetical protein